MEKQERMVVHLELDGNNFYYGNLKALTDAWNKDIHGVSYNYLKNYNISPEKPYKGKNCTIRKVSYRPQQEKRNKTTSVSI